MKYKQWCCQYIWYKDPDATMSEQLLQSTDFTTPEALAFKFAFERALQMIQGQINTLRSEV